VDSLQKNELSVPGVWELRPRIFRDSRGFFMETYNQKEFANLGIADSFVQDNHSSSVRGTIRGLHYQLHYAQAKLCRVVEGEVLDVAVDIRVGSPHFGKWASVVLSQKEQNQVYIPRGFAHGYLALSETVQFLYKCTDFYRFRGSALRPRECRCLPSESCLSRPQNIPQLLAAQRIPCFRRDASTIALVFASCLGARNCNPCSSRMNPRLRFDT
jgi:dTDP-4-dehydrorhamnose 3,5-epimerase